MIFELTTEEKNRISALDQQYQDAIKQGSAVQLAEYSATIERLRQAMEAAEQRYFDSLPHDPDSLLENAKKQIDLTVKQDSGFLFAYRTVNDPEMPETAKATYEDLQYIIADGIRLFLNEIKDPEALQNLATYISEKLADAGIEKTKTAALPVHVSKWRNTIKYYGMMNDKINKDLLAVDPLIKEIDGQMKLLWTVNKANPEKPVPVYVCLTYAGAERIAKIDKRITKFDEGVLNAIGTIAHAKLNAGERFPIRFTVEDVWRTRNGIRDTRRTPSKKQIDRYRKSMDKMRFIRLWMDRSEEIKQFHITQPNGEPLDNCQIDAYYLSGRWDVLGAKNGHKVEVFTLFEMPPIFDYNLSNNHVVYVPFELLYIPEINLSPFIEEIRDYFLLEIERLYNGSRNNNTFRLDTIHKNAGWPTPAERIDRSKYKSESSYQSKLRTEEAADRAKVENILKSFKTKKYIQGFSINKSGRTYSVTINLRKELFNRKSALLDPELLKLSAKKSAQ